MKSRTPRRLKWLLICVGVALVGWLVWIAVQDLSPIDIRSQASRATAIGYGTLHTANGSSLTVGTTVYTPPLGSESRHPDGFIVFFHRTGLLGSGRLRSAAILAIYQGRVASEDMPVSEAKALCVATNI